MKNENMKTRSKVDFAKNSDRFHNFNHIIRSIKILKLIEHH